MTVAEHVVRLAESLPWPDAVTRAGIEAMVGRTRERLASVPQDDARAFAADMARFPVATNTQDANAQHYELPAAFFALILGPRRKYSCAFYETPAMHLADAEVDALARTADNAGLADGQHILELGCGWGSLSLWMAQQYPHARITAVSNSHSQRDFILAQSAASGFANLDVITADMNNFAPTGRFDRVVSVEMFEHMANWRALLERIHTWLREDGRLFLHVFTHVKTPYRFDAGNKADWIAQHFFTGGIMPSHDLIRQFDDLFALEQEWRWAGTHYARTAEDWLANFDRNIAEIDVILRSVYSADARLWRRRWRLFFLATRGLFGHRDGAEWGVSHYRLRPAR